MKDFFILLYKAFLKFKDDDCITLSSAISFVFILSLIPFLTLGIKLFKAIQGYFMFSEIHINHTDFLLNELSKIIPFISTNWIKANILSQTGGTSLTIFSILMMPMISGIIFHELETAYRRIFNVKTKFMIFRQFFYAFFSIIILLFIFATNFAWAVISTFLSQFEFIFRDSIFLHQIIYFIVNSWLFHTRILSIFLLIFFFIATAKIFLPNYIEIPLKLRFFSATLFAFLWLFAKAVFAYYIKHISIVNIIYGSISSVVIILLWIFYSSITLLFSVEVMYLLNKKSREKTTRL